jgi:hypothetical protein
MIDGIPRSLPSVMRAELPSLTDEIIIAIRRDIPEYARSMEGPYGEALRTGVGQSLKAFVDRVADPSAPTDERDATCRLLGELEAGEGRPLDDLQAAYRIGCQTAWRRMTKVVLRQRLSSSVTAALADAMFSYADELARLSAEGYRKAQATSAASQQQCRTRLARELLARPAAPREILEKRADHARWPLPQTVTVIALRPDPAPAGGPGVPGVPAQADLSHIDNDVLADLDSSAPCLIVPGTVTKTLRSVLATALPGHQIAIGLTVPVDLAPDSLRWAQQTLQLADQGIVAPSPVIACDKHLIEMWLLSDATLAQEIVRRQVTVLAQIPENERAWLIDTFEPWLERRGTAVEIGKILGIHPQTVRYRINRLKEIFGDIIDDPDQRLAFELTLRVMRLLRGRDGGSVSMGEMLDAVESPADSVV